MNLLAHDELGRCVRSEVGAGEIAQFAAVAEDGEAVGYFENVVQIVGDENNAEAASTGLLDITEGFAGLAYGYGRRGLAFQKGLPGPPWVTKANLYLAAAAGVKKPTAKRLAISTRRDHGMPFSISSTGVVGAKSTQPVAHCQAPCRQWVAGRAAEAYYLKDLQLTALKLIIYGNKTRR